MPIARVYDAKTGQIVTTIHDGYLDRLLRWSDIQEYLPFMHKAARSYPGVRVLELGARKGNSTLTFLSAAQMVNGTVVSVDIDPIIDDREGMNPWKDCPWWEFIQGDDMDEAILARLPAEVDVLFVDTSHEYDHTLRELRAYMPRVAPGGLALFHDTTRLGVWDHESTIPSVARALDDYCAEMGITWENLPGEYGLGVILNADNISSGQQDNEPPAGRTAGERPVGLA